MQQRVAIGPLAFVAGGAMVEGSVPACLRAKGDRARLAGVNVEGLRRAGFGREAILVRRPWESSEAPSHTACCAVDFTNSACG